MWGIKHFWFLIVFGEYPIVNLERLHVISAVIVLITVYLYQNNKTAVASTINGVAHYGTNLISTLSHIENI